MGSYPPVGGRPFELFVIEDFVLKIYCGVEQLVARWAHNPKVVRSSRAPATSERFRNESLFCFVDVCSLRTLLPLLVSVCNADG